MVNLRSHHFTTHKKAETAEDCQDACQVNETDNLYAIADGATLSFFPKRWADLLVKHFCERPNQPLTQENWKEWLEPIQKEWYKQVEKRVKMRNVFYLTNSFNDKDPAVSTFIGLQIDKDNKKWKAIIIGDSCLFHKSSSGFKSYLIEKSEAFTNHPAAFASYPDKSRYVPTFVEGKIQSGDLLILATDALAKWIVEHKETNQLEKALKQLKKIKTPEQFNHFITLARDNENIRLVNDDVTLLLISIEDDESSEVETEIKNNPVKVDVDTPEDVEPQFKTLGIAFWIILTGFFGFVFGAALLIWFWSKER